MVLPRLSPTPGGPTDGVRTTSDPPPVQGPGGRLDPGPGGGGGGGDDDDEQDSDDDDERGPDDMQRTIEQLRSTGDPNEVERTPVLESGNIDVAPDEWQLGFPLQGIPRLAAVLNLNYQYSESRDRWEREETRSNTGPTRRFVVESNLNPFSIDSRTFQFDEARRYHSISAFVAREDVQDGPVALEIALGAPIAALSPSSGNVETADKKGVAHAFMLGRSSADSTGGPAAETTVLGGGEGVILDAGHEVAYTIRGVNEQVVNFRLNYSPL